MGLRLAWVVWVFALRFFGAQPALIVPAVDSPPPPAETQLDVADEDAADSDGDDPSDLDDDDNDSDDVALPARIAADVPDAVAYRPLWAIPSLHDKCTCEQLFRPPRRA